MFYILFGVFSGAKYLCQLIKFEIFVIPIGHFLEIRASHCSTSNTMIRIFLVSNISLKLLLLEISIYKNRKHHSTIANLANIKCLCLHRNFEKFQIKFILLRFPILIYYLNILLTPSIMKDRGQGKEFLTDI
jgi:hypothetical protein